MNKRLEQKMYRKQLRKRIRKRRNEISLLTCREGLVLVIREDAFTLPLCEWLKKNIFEDTYTIEIWTKKEGEDITNQESVKKITYNPKEEPRKVIADNSKEEPQKTITDTQKEEPQKMIADNEREEQEKAATEPQAKLSNLRIALQTADGVKYMEMSEPQQMRKRSRNFTR